MDISVCACVCDWSTLLNEGKENGPPLSNVRHKRTGQMKHGAGFDRLISSPK